MTGNGPSSPALEAVPAPASTAPREVVNVRIRGRGEATLEERFHDLETVAMFKHRVFGAEMREGRQCRLIARGRELLDAVSMGSYKIEDGACLHVVIGQSGSAARAVGGNTSVGTAGRQEDPISGVGSAAFFVVTGGTLLMLWACLVVWPDIFNMGATALLVCLSVVSVLMWLPYMKKNACEARSRWRGQPADRSARLRQ